MINQHTLDFYTQANLSKMFSVQTFNAQNVSHEIHRHNFFQIILLNKGKVRHMVDFECKEAEAPYLSVIFPNQVHRIEMSDDAEADIILFNEAVFCSALLSNELKEYNIDLQNRLNHICEPTAEGWTEIQEMLGSIRTQLPKLNTIRNLEVKFMIKIILLKIIDMAPEAYYNGKHDPDLQLYQQFREKVNDDFITQKKVKYYADELGISGKRLTHICLKYTGQSPLQIIHEKLCVELKKALAEDGRLMKEIAFHYGFSSQSALNKFTVRQFGCAPQELRKELEEEMLCKL